MRHRSRTVALCILGAASFTLAGCREETVEAEAFSSLDSCKRAALSTDGLTEQDCETSFEEAQALHVEAAPRYESLAVCEEQHGAGACGSEAEATSGQGSGGIFMPLLAGYLIGSMMSGRSGMVGSQPLYRKAGGGFTNAAGTGAYSSNAGRASVSSSQFARPPATVGQPPMSRAAAASRGGFGATGGSRATFGG